MVHAKLFTLAAIASSAQASLTADQVVSNIDQITELSAKTNSIAKSISVTNFFSTAPQLINNFQQIISVASDDISSMGINKKKRQEQPVIPLETPGTTDVPYSQDGTQCTGGDAESCLQDALQIIENPSELLGNAKRQDLYGESPIAGPLIGPLIGSVLGNEDHEKRQNGLLGSLGPLFGGLGSRNEKRQDGILEGILGGFGNRNEKRQAELLDGLPLAIGKRQEAADADPLDGLSDGILKRQSDEPAEDDPLDGLSDGILKRQDGDVSVPVAGPVTANVPVPDGNDGDCVDANVEGCVTDATQIIEDPGQLLGSKKRSHVGGIAGRAIAARQAAGYSDSSQEAVCTAFRGFVQVHQQLLATVIGKHGLLAATPFTAPMAQVLRVLEGGVDTLAFGIIDLVPTCAQDAKQNLDSLDQSLGQAIETYSN